MKTIHTYTASLDAIKDDYPIKITMRTGAKILLAKVIYNSISMGDRYLYITALIEDSNPRIDKVFRLLPAYTEIPPNLKYVATIKMNEFEESYLFIE